ncbi:MAG: hypothetical protein AB8H80_21605, partial [Planctomycetota bacterium]
MREHVLAVDPSIAESLGFYDEATGVLRIDRSTLIGAGSSGGGGTCSTSPLGAPLTGINRQGPIEIGTMFEATMQGVAGD